MNFYNLLPTFLLETQANVQALLLLRRNLPLRRDYLLLLLFWLHLRRMGAAVRYIMPQRRSQLLAVVGEDLRILCATRNGNVGHAVVEQVFGSQLSIGVDQHTVGRSAPGCCDSSPRSRGQGADSSLNQARPRGLRPSSNSSAHPSRCLRRSQAHGWPASSRERVW